MWFHCWLSAGYGLQNISHPHLLGYISTTTSSSSAQLELDRLLPCKLPPPYPPPPLESSFSPTQKLNPTQKNSPGILEKPSSLHTSLLFSTPFVSTSPRPLEFASCSYASRVPRLRSHLHTYSSTPVAGLGSDAYRPSSGPSHRRGAAHSRFSRSKLTFGSDHTTRTMTNFRPTRPTSVPEWRPKTHVSFRMYVPCYQGERGDPY